MPFISLWQMTVRICVDMRKANCSIQRVCYLIPTVAGISQALNGCKFFSKLDSSQAYHQLELDECSRYITIFSTHVRLYQYKKLNYGMNAAAELFQHTLPTVLQGLDSARNLADDIIIFATTQEDNNLALLACFKTSCRSWPNFECLKVYGFSVILQSSFYS